MSQILPSQISEWNAFLYSITCLLEKMCEAEAELRNELGRRKAGLEGRNELGVIGT